MIYGVLLFVYWITNTGRWVTNTARIGAVISGAVIPGADLLRLKIYQAKKSPP